MLRDAAADGGLNEYLVERDYWMCQVATELLMESVRYPGSYTSMGGGSLLSLAGITERLSEDVDINVTFVDGANACCRCRIPVRRNRRHQTKSRCDDRCTC